MGQFSNILGSLASPLGVALALALLFSYQAGKALLSPLRTVPGPFWARFTRAWYLQKVWRGDFEKTNIDLHTKYGPIVRIAPNEFSLNDVESTKIIYGHGTAFTKSAWYAASGSADPNVHDLFTDRNPKRHGENRRKVAGLYSMTSLLQYEQHVNDLTEKFVARFTELALTRSDGAAGFNMQHWLQCFAFDMIGLITLAASFGFVDNPQDSHTMFDALHTYLIYAANVGIYSEFHRFLSRFLGWITGGGMAYMLTFTAEQIAKRTKESKTKVGGSDNSSPSTDFLTMLLQTQREQPDKLSDADVFGACLTNIGAGSDTTSVSLSAILYYLIKNPDAYQKLQNELDEKAENREISSPIKFQEAQTLPYLQACIKEGLRMHPATGLPLARVVPKGGVTLAGRFFPEGTVVGINTWVMHRNTAVFGEDADTFRPERWLESPERSSYMERFFMTFGLGSRTCIGKNISLMEISKLVPELVRHFNFQLANPREKLETENVWFVKQKNFRCHVSLRKQISLNGS